MKILKYIVCGGLLFMLFACQSNVDVAQKDGIGVFAYNDYEDTGVHNADVWHKNTTAAANETLALNLEDSMIAEANLAKIKEIAHYLNTNSGMRVKLLGRSKAEGSNAYNNAILWAKMREIAGYIEQDGIDYARISIISLAGQKFSSKPGENGLVEVFYLEA